MRHASNYDVCVSKNGKQCIWRAICEKSPFPISPETVVFGLLGSIPNPQHCKFFAGYASSGCFEVLRFNHYEYECVMLIRC